MKSLKNIFSFEPPHNRMGRKAYFLIASSSLCIGLVLGGLAFILLLFALPTGMMDSPILVFGAIGLVVSIVSIINILAALKRLKDIGVNGWWVLLLFINPINFLFMLFLVFKKGKGTIAEEVHEPFIPQAQPPAPQAGERAPVSVPSSALEPAVPVESPEPNEPVKTEKQEGEISLMSGNPDGDTPRWSSEKE